MSSPPSPLPALIVGAGPVGLTMAMHLHQQGMDFRILDKAPIPSDKSKALAIWGRSQEMLDRLGLMDRFASAGMFLNGGRFYANGQQVVRFTLDVEGTPYPRPLLLPQSETERLLTEHLRQVGITVERPVELIDLTDSGNQVTATLRHADGREEPIRCDWLLGCDGAHSFVRKKLGFEFAGTANPNDWVLADCRIDGPIPMDEVTIFWHAKGVAAFFPFTPARCRVIADIGLAGSTEKPPDPSLAEVQAIVDERCPAGIRLSEPHWLAGFRINERKVTEYRRGRAFLCGDAAHIHSPAGGQGMNTGMQDTWNLAWKLALVHRGKGRPALLDSYSSERGAVGALVLRQAGLLTALATLRNPAARFLRNNTLRLLLKLPAFRRNFVRNLAEMTIHYPASPLNGESAGPGWTRGSIRPGDRFPDVRLRNPQTAKDERLLHVLRGTGYDLLLLPRVGDGATLATLQSIQQRVEATYPGLVRCHLIVPSGGMLADAQGFSSCWIDAVPGARHHVGARETALALIRPDGYLAFRSQPASWEDLRGYLEKFLVIC